MNGKSNTQMKKSITIITGKAGSGKTRKAIAMCESAGKSYAHKEMVRPDQLKGFGLSDFIAQGKVDTIIVDLVPAAIDGHFLSVMKSLTGSDTVTINQRYQKPLELRKKPNFIICVQSASPIPLDKSISRRITQINL